MIGSYNDNKSSLEQAVGECSKMFLCLNSERVAIIKTLKYLQCIDVDVIGRLSLDYRMIHDRHSADS